MVRTLRWRLVAIMGIFVVLMGTANVIGLRIMVDRNAERQAYLAGQSVATWGTATGDVRAIDPARLHDLAPVAAVVALIDSTGEIVAISSESTVAAAQLEAIAAATPEGSTTQAELGGRSMAFTRVAFDSGTVYRDAGDIPLASAVVGVGTEGADRLVNALVLGELIVLGAILVVASLTLTVVISRTTRTLTRLSERVELDDMAGVGEIASEFSETDELARALVRLDRTRARSEQELRDFVADTSHELKTPLTKIQGWSELHFQTPDDAERTEQALESIAEESHRMRVLVDQLTLLARAESVSAQEHEEVDLSALCEEFIAGVRLGGEASVRSDVAPGVIVFGDGYAITQVLRNLVGNSLVHAGPDATVDVALHRTGDEAILEIMDDGVGIPEDAQSRVFDRFYTGNRSAGTGLGLAIVRGIVTAHGGTVELDSRTGEGTRVTIRLPVAR